MVKQTKCFDFYLTEFFLIFIMIVSYKYSITVFKGMFNDKLTRPHRNNGEKQLYIIMIAKKSIQLCIYFCANENILSQTTRGNLYAWFVSNRGVTGPWGWKIILACYQQNRLQPSVASPVCDKVGLKHNAAQWAYRLQDSCSVYL